MVPLSHPDFNSRSKSTLDASEYQLATTVILPDADQY